MDVVVRLALEQDVRRAGEVTLEAYEALEGGFLDDDYRGQLLDAAARADEAVLFVAVKEGEVLGSVTYVPDERNPWAEDLRAGEASIRMLAVAPAAHGQGIGELLVNACLERATVDARTGVFLHSTRWMASAHRLYHRLGFERRPDRDWTPEPGFTLLAFHRSIGPLPSQEPPGGLLP